MSEELISFNCELEHQTELAWLMTIEDEQVWLPKSQCEWDENEGTILVPEWLAIEKGLV